MPVQKQCVVCGKVFSVPPVRSKTAKACSNECAVRVRAKSRERKVEKVCLFCGEVFLIPQSHEQRRVYCSMKCSKKGVAVGQSEKMSGASNHMWRGGEQTHSMGYVSVPAKHHPYSVKGYVFKHRLVVEEMLKEGNPDSVFLEKHGDQLYLSRSVSVHHLDGDKKNNRRRNLLVCTKTAHANIHNGKMPGPGEFWPEDAKIKLGRKNNEVKTK